MLMFLLRPAFALALGAALLSAPAQAVTFTFNYTDPAGVGFNAAGAVGQARRDAMELAGQNFASAFSSYTANVTVDVDGSATGGTLMGAADNGAPNFNPGFGLGEVVRNKVLSNGASDLNGATADGFVVVNFSSVAWELDISETPDAGADEFDWYSTAYHELLHAFGFASIILTDANGMNATDPFGTTGANDGDWAKFDEFLTDALGTSVFSGADLDEATYEALLTGGNSANGDGLFFNGPNAVAANGDNPVGLYTPNPFEEGSSGSHIDDENPAFAGQLMLAATGPGPSARTLSAIELGVLRDIGYTMVTQISVPEPSTLLLMLSGALLLRTRSRRS